MPPMFTKDEWFTEVDETDGVNLPETPILTVTVHDEDETNKFQYKAIFIYLCNIFLDKPISGSILESDWLLPNISYH